MASFQSQEPARASRTARAKGTPLRVLVVIDGSERTGRIIDYLLDLAQNERGLALVLLGLVRAPPETRLGAHGSFKRAEIHAHLAEVLGQRAVAAVARRLDQEEVVHKDRVEVGEPVETILRVAREENSDLILLGDGPVRPIERWLPKLVGLTLATVARHVVQEASVPVTVVK